MRSRPPSSRSIPVQVVSHEHAGAQGEITGEVFCPKIGHVADVGGCSGCVRFAGFEHVEGDGVVVRCREVLVERQAAIDAELWHALGGVSVGQVMEAELVSVHGWMPVSSIAAAVQPVRWVVVTDSSEMPTGVIDRLTLPSRVHAHGGVASEVMDPLPHVLRDDAPLVQALSMLTDVLASVVPVVDREGRIVGLFTGPGFLSWLREHVVAASKADESAPSSAYIRLGAGVEVVGEVGAPAPTRRPPPR